MSACRQPEPTLVDILVESFADLLVSRGRLPEPAASEAATRAVEELLLRMGGRKWYFPRPGSASRSPLQDRNQMIRSAWRRGTPVVVILRTYHLKKSQFYAILANKEVA